MKTKISALAALAVALGFGAQAKADVIAFNFSGPGGVSGSGLLTYVPDVSPTDPNSSCGTSGNNPCRTDPVGAYAITGISGTFSDGTAGIANAAITGLVPINPVNERDTTFDPLVPTSLSFIDYTNEADPTKALSYNNLFFPDGSPIDCAFPNFGTFLDVFGMAFTIAGGDDDVVLWGDGDLFGPGSQTYGVAVTDGVNELDYQFAGVDASVPEPASLALLGVGLAGIGLIRRRKRA